MLTSGRTYKVFKVTQINETVVAYRIQQYLKSSKIPCVYNITIDNCELDIQEGDYIKILGINAISYNTKFSRGKTWVNVQVNADIELVEVDVHKNKEEVDKQITSLPF